MKSSPLAIASFLSLLAFVASACGDKDSSGKNGDGDSGDGDGLCEAGSESCPCYADESCDSGLTCVGSMCEATEAGDGDGDEGSGGTIGDGDDGTGGAAEESDTGGSSGDGDMGGASGGSDAMGGSSMAEECSADIDCEDEDACTDDRCVDSVCEHVALSSLCESGTCLAGALHEESTVSCAETIDTGDFQVCQSSSCSGSGTPGCDVAYTFGWADAETSLGNDDTRTTTLSIPIVSLDLSGADFTAGNSNCLLSADIADGAPATVEVTIVTQGVAMCGEGEEVISRSVSPDLSNLLFSVTPGEGTTTLCTGANLALLPGSPLRAEAEAALAPGVTTALETVLDSVVTVGTSCASCSGTCDGLSCSEPVAAD